MKKFILSTDQERLLFVDQSSGTKPLFNIAITIYLEGELNVEALKDAFILLGQRHEILRLRIQDAEYSPESTICGDDISLNIIEYNASTKNINDIKNFMKDKASIKLDLFNDGLFKAYLIVMGKNQYYLLIVMHHIITDGWSNNLLLNDLSAIYKAINLGSKPNLPTLSYSYSDYVMQQQELLGTNYYKDAIKFWINHLSNAPEILELPTNKTRPLEATYRGGNHTIKLDLSTLSKIKEYTKSHKVTLYCFLLSVFQCLLHACSSEKNIVVGCPSVNRAKNELGNVVGLFVNVMPVCSNILPEQTFRSFMQGNMIDLIECYQHQDFPFDKLVDSLSIHRALNYHPIFQVLFTLHTYYDNSNLFDGLKKEFIQLEGDFTKFDLSLFCSEDNNGLLVKFNYSLDLFEYTTIIALADAFQNIISSILKDDSIFIKDIPLATAHKANQSMVCGSNILPVSQGDKWLVHFIFKKVVEQNKNKIAIIEQNEHYTYKIIDEYSDKFGLYLQNLGCKANDIIAVSLEPGLQYVITIIGILKIGAAYLPIDTDYPDERINYILSDSEVIAVVTKNKFLDKFKNFNKDIVDLERDWETILALNHSDILIEGGDVACIMYTSGSTDKPKGVIYKHSSICNRTFWVQKEYPFDPKDTSISLSSISFVDFITEAIIPLLSGVKTIISNQLVLKNPELLIPLLSRFSVTRINIIPSLLQELCNNYTNIKALLPRLKQCEVSGEKFSESLMLKAMSILKGVKVINRYGSTEATSIIYNELFLTNDNNIKVHSKVISNTCVYILDKNMHLMPRGIIGEICVSGAAIALGYVHNDLNKGKFIFNSHLCNSDNVVLRTGDLGYFTDDGEVIILGRRDSQVKINGFRVDLSEIQYRLEQNEMITQAIVICSDIDTLSKNIIAYIKLEQNDVENIDILLRLELEKYLPDYMIPSRFIIVDSFPLGRNGKIDLQQLSKFIDTEFSNSYTAPRNIKEFKLSKIWSDILKQPFIGIDDNFFKIGGNSILAIRLIATVRKVFLTNFAINNIYQSPSIREMVNSLEDQVTNLHTDLLSPIQVTGTKTPIFLIHSAIGLSFPYNLLSKYLIDQPLYGINHPAYSDSPLDLESIEEMANHYIESIKLIQNTGPYYLGGWSFGGLVALEMAHQLQLQGQEVKLVFLFDTSNYPKKDTEDYSDEAIDKWLIEIGINIKTKELESGFLREHSRKADKLIKKYYPKKYYGRVVLVKARDEELTSPFRQSDISQGWSSIIGKNMEIYSVPSTHNTLWSNHNIENIAKILKYTIYTYHPNATLINDAPDILSVYLQHATAYKDEFIIKRVLDLQNITKQIDDL